MVLFFTLSTGIASLLQSPLLGDTTFFRANLFDETVEELNAALPGLEDKPSTNNLGTSVWIVKSMRFKAIRHIDEV